MARGYEARIGMDGREFNKAVKADIIKPVEDAARTLDDLGTDGAHDVGKLEDALKEAQRQTDKLDRSMEQVDDTSRKTWDGASENVQEFKNEAVQNFSEVASSFNGDISQMADGVQGLTGGLASALTPGIGIPIAILGAAAAAFAAGWAKAAEDSKQQVSDMYDDFIESGASFVSEDFIGKTIQEIQNGESAWGTWEDALNRAKETGLDVSTILRAMAGDQQAIADTHAAYVAKRDEELQKVRDVEAATYDHAAAAQDVNGIFQDQTEWIRRVQENQGTAAEKARAYRDAVGGAVSKMDELAAKWANIPKSQQLQLNVSSNFDRVFNEMARKANQGIRVTLRADGSQGRGWE